jgi:archaellum component FlaC
MLDILKSSREDLDEKFANNEIDHAEYAEGMQKINSLARESLNNIAKTKEDIKNHYAAVLEEINKEIEKETVKIDHASGVLNSYQNIMGVMGKKDDYGSMDAILRAS